MRLRIPPLLLMIAKKLGGGFDEAGCLTSANGISANPSYRQSAQARDRREARSRARGKCFPPSAFKEKMRTPPSLYSQPRMPNVGAIVRGYFD